MTNVTLKGTINLAGRLTFKGASGGKVMVGGAEALVEVQPSAAPQCTAASPVIMPPPPGSPVQPEPTAWIVTSFNKTVKAGTQCLVTQGMAMQGSTGAPMWPGMVLPSSGNPTVTVQNIPINVVNDSAMIFPSGGSASFTSSGQT